MASACINPVQKLPPETPSGDVLALARQLAAAADRGDVAEVIRLATAIVQAGEPDAMAG
jgi:hypothetical protein